MHPYRDLERVADEPCDDARRDDAALALLLLAIGGLRVAVAVVLGQPLDAEVALATAMVVGGAALAAQVTVRSRAARPRPTAACGRRRG